MSDAGFNERQLGVLSFEIDPTDGMVSITVIDPVRSSRQFGIMPEVRILRIDGGKWSEQIEEIVGDINDLVDEYERAGAPMTRPGRGTNDTAE